MPRVQNSRKHSLPGWYKAPDLPHFLLAQLETSTETREETSGQPSGSLYSLKNEAGVRRTTGGVGWGLFNVSHLCARLSHLIPHLQFMSSMYT